MLSSDKLGPTNVLIPSEWTLVHSTDLDPREATLRDTSDLELCAASRRYLAASFPAGIYAHQHRAINEFLHSKNVCLATGTASGKTLAFTIAAMQCLHEAPNARVLALYPQRALGNEQQHRWNKALTAAGLTETAGRIDGSIATSRRPQILKDHRVIVATPDVLHAWFMSHLDEPSVKQFFKGLHLLIVDEVHTYTGVLGSNSAYLFRRLQQATTLLGKRPHIFAASATIREPERHLRQLFGVNFALVGPDQDTSPRHRISVHMMRPPASGDLLTHITAYLRTLSDKTDHRFIAFVDSRKLTEQIATIAGRQAASDRDSDVDDELDASDPLEGAPILPYRSGYEEKDREIIERRLGSGSLRGVVSTSALELGIDIPHLDVAVLIGVPRSSTSLYQRIGRIGRTAPGEVVVVSTGDVFDEAVFREPAELLARPPAESALYLENTRIQYIHALCLARVGGEFEAAAATGAEFSLSEELEWPAGFVKLCEAEHTGQIPAELQAMKAEAGEEPTYAFPLRDVESQFRVNFKLGPIEEGRGSLSYSQVLREGYPGAVYYYATQAYRVTSVALHTRTIVLRKERRYSTAPIRLPTLIYPNQTAGNILRLLQFGPMRLMECQLQVREALLGFNERRGSRKEIFKYPLADQITGVKFPYPRFTRNFFTTGVLLQHECLGRPGVELPAIAELVYEALLMVAPYARADINFAVDEVRADGGPLPKGAKFICIYDQTYGSLRLSGRLGVLETCRAVGERLIALLNGPLTTPIGANSRLVVEELIQSLATMPEPIAVPGHALAPDPESGRVKIIMPGCTCINASGSNQEFTIDWVFMHPKLGLAYRGHTNGIAVTQGQIELWPVSSMMPIPGVSTMGYYNMETGELEAEDQT
jgi:DEAD/DEAH box helicase domain-containing protein